MNTFAMMEAGKLSYPTEENLNKFINEFSKCSEDINDIPDSSGIIKICQEYIKNKEMKVKFVYDYFVSMIKYYQDFKYNILIENSDSRYPDIKVDESKINDEIKKAVVYFNIPIVTSLAPLGPDVMLGMFEHAINTTSKDKRLWRKVIRYYRKYLKEAYQTVTNMLFDII